MSFTWIGSDLKVFVGVEHLQQGGDGLDYMYIVLVGRRWFRLHVYCTGREEMV